MNPLTADSKTPAGKPPPLREGERLTRDEFERRYEAMPDVKKAELLEGTVYIGSPVRQDQHGRPQAQLMGWMFLYHAATPGVDIGDNASWRIDDANEPQPDGILRIETASGSSSIDNQGYVRGAIEFAAEVSASTSSRDLGVKFRLYQRCGVREYVVWRVLDHEIDWFVFRDGAFVRKAPDADGVLRSDALPGLWLDATALVEGNSAAVVATLQRGLQSQGHAEFVSRLEADLGQAE